MRCGLALLHPPFRPDCLAARGEAGAPAPSRTGRTAWERPIAASLSMTAAHKMPGLGPSLATALRARSPDAPGEAYVRLDLQSSGRANGRELRATAKPLKFKWLQRFFCWLRAERITSTAAGLPKIR